MSNKDCRLLHNFLDSHYLMSLATTNAFSLWSTPVKFINDKYLNIYFISEVHTVYVNNIMNNHKVSLLIADLSKTSLNVRMSIQACGFCEKLNVSRIMKILEKWNKKFSNSFLSVEDMEKNDISFFKIILTRVKYIDTNLVEKVVEFNF